jgi:hypothetical protein
MAFRSGDRETKTCAWDRQRELVGNREPLLENDASRLVELVLDDLFAGCFSAVGTDLGKSHNR